MVRIVVFDSGLGSLSVIKPIQKQIKCNTVYYADTKNFPYGKKSIKEIREITLQTISALKKLFKPDLIVVGSNTLSFTMDSHSKNIFIILPPLSEAKKITKSKSIAILVTESIVKSKLLDNYITKFKMKNIKVIKVNVSPLIELVEHGKFYSNPNLCKKVIKQTLSTLFTKNNVDVATLSSTHLPFLIDLLQTIFPNITFLDPSKLLAKKLKQKYFDDTKKRNTLQIFTSGSISLLQKNLEHLGIKNKITKLTIE